MGSFNISAENIFNSLRGRSLFVEGGGPRIVGGGHELALPSYGGGHELAPPSDGGGHEITWRWKAIKSLLGHTYVQYIGFYVGGHDFTSSPDGGGSRNRASSRWGGAQNYGVAIFQIPHPPPSIMTAP